MASTKQLCELFSENNALIYSFSLKRISKGITTPKFSAQLEEEIKRLDKPQKEIDSQIVILKQKLAALHYRRLEIILTPIIVASVPESDEVVIGSFTPRFIFR